MRLCHKRAPVVRGIHQPSVAFWEAGTQSIGVEQLVVLFDVLALTVEERVYALELVKATATSTLPAEEPSAA